MQANGFVEMGKTVSMFASCQYKIFKKLKEFSQCPKIKNIKARTILLRLEAQVSSC